MRMAKKPHMFSRIFDFRYQRTGLQGFGFFLAYFCFYILWIGVCTGLMIMAGLIPDDDAGLKNHAMTMKPLIGGSYILALTFLMLRARDLLAERYYVLGGFALIVIGTWLSPFYALIPLCYLSTRPVERPSA